MAGDGTAETDAARPHRGRRRALAAAGVLLLSLVAALAWLLLGGDKPRPVTLDEARDRTDVGSTLTTVSEGFGPPSGGVYRYRGSGTEKTSFPPLTEEQGPAMPATVTADGDGCWRFRIDYNSHHWQDWRYCAGPSGIVTTGGRSFARRELGTVKIDNTSTFTCAGPDLVLWVGMQVGETQPGSCQGTSTAVGGTTTSAGPTTYVGDDDIEVGGETIRARHLRFETELSGAQEGTERADWWVDPDTMLPIRNEHRVTVTTKVGSISITYAEAASYTLTSLIPE